MLWSISILSVVKERKMLIKPGKVSIPAHVSQMLIFYYLCCILSVLFYQSKQQTEHFFIPIFTSLS